MIAILMKVFKNLFGNGSKINASEVVTKNAAGDVVGLDLAGMEVGQNENGSWVRWNNGWQECWIFVREWPDSAPNSTSGSLYRTANFFTWTYPKPFVDEPIISGTCSSASWLGGGDTPTRNNKASCIFRVYRATQSNNDVTIRLKAIGWWKEPGT